jgi:hypothetical protein
MPLFGVTTEGKQQTDGSYSYKFEVEGLTAQTQYTVFALLEDYGNN